MTTILVVDDVAVIRDPIAAALRLAGYKTITAANGKEALELVRTVKPDLVLLDIAMPVMNGLEMLAAVRAEPAIASTPVILLTAASEREYVMQAAKHGVRDYLLKSQFSLDELTSRVARRLEALGAPAPVKGGAADQPGEADAPADDAGASGDDEALPAAPDGAASALVFNPGDDPAEALKAMKPVIKRSDINECIENCSELKAFSPTVAAIMKLVRSQGCSIDDLAKAIKRDQAVSVKVLQIANSAVYTRGAPVETIEKAVLRIGMSQISQVLMNIAVVEQFSVFEVDGFLDAREFWEHSISTGVIAAEIAHSLNDKEVDLAFTMGLVHDIGRIIFAQELGETYAAVFRAAQELGLPMEQVETRLLLMNHADGVDRLLHRWNFPKELIDPIVFHHLSVGNIRRMAPQRLPKIATLGLANRLSHAMLIGSSGNDVVYATEELCDALKVTPETVARIEEITRDQTDSMKVAMVAGNASGGWEDRRDRYRKELAAPFRPVFASAKPALDAFRIVCDQIRDRGEEPPNIGVAHLRTMQERARVTNELTSAETLAGAKNLPVVCISPTGQIRLEEHALKNRTCVTLQSPVTVSRLVDTINALIGGGEAKAAA